jgi:hypothetical protein
MFVNKELQDHLETSSTVRVQSSVIAEWNMNIAENIAQVGNYRFRPNGEDPKYKNIAGSFSFDDLDSMFYTGATDADIIIDGGLDDLEVPMVFVSKKEKEGLLYSLEDCFGRFRPRSGINKLRFFENRFSHHDTISMTRRPRYYASDKRDPFKYWSSYRTEEGQERGISNLSVNGTNQIEDAAPYIVYKDRIPANRIVVKMQTNVGDVNLGPFTNSSGTFDDPLYGEQNKTTPIRWKIQYLLENNWVDIISFNDNSRRRDGSQIIGSDGYVEVGYGLVVPDKYLEFFKIDREISSVTLLPDPSGFVDGTAYLVKGSEKDRGVVHVIVNEEYETFDALYDWRMEDGVTSATSFVTDLTSPPEFEDNLVPGKQYREFQYIGGLRIVVETMNVFDSTFDLIELSPRLTVDLSEKVTSFSVNKSASDLGISGMPIGQLLAGTGSLDIFDFDQAFFKENTSSIIHKYTSQNIQFKLYEIVVDVNGVDYFVPIKTMYSEGFPDLDSASRNVSLSLRDLFFYFESSAAPQMLVQEASLSYAVSLLLDSAGFSNYIFLRNENEGEDVIPYFYIEPDKTVAEILNEIARSTQTAMFFDEYNNFICMSKNYIMPSPEERDTDLFLYGTKDFQDSGIVKNEKTQAKLSNIIKIASQESSVYNDGAITYSTRHIQRSYGSIRQASLLDRDKTWIYKPVLLWEVSATENTKSVNEEVGQQSAYVLGAIPLNSDLSISLPSVSNHQVIDNTIDFGEGIYWLTRYNGYFYANGEIVKYDAVQYSIPGLSGTELSGTDSDGDSVWITSVREYQKYFAKVPFNGKIYPTGLVRIYSEPNYESIGGVTRMENGPVAKSGRGQFGTDVVTHPAGLSPHWADAESVRGIRMSSKYLFGRGETYKTINEVSVSSNDPVAVFLVPDASIFSIGEHIERYSPTADVISPSTENYIQPNTTVQAINLENNTITTNKLILRVSEENAITTISVTAKAPETRIGPAGIDNERASATVRTGLIKNFFANESQNEISSIQKYPATIQSSALVLSGSLSDTGASPRDLVSYVYKPLENRFRHFGTRIRVIGKVENNDIRPQSPSGGSTYFTATEARSDQSVTIAGGSGGLGVLLNPETNNGYYFEIAALTASNINDYDTEENVSNMFFYKIKQQVTDDNGTLEAIPVKLWSGIGNILVDDGLFTGQARMSAEAQTTVYDLAVEYEDVGESRRFYLYLNNSIVAIVDDPDPLPTYNNMSLFVRGSAKCMFENVYALTDNYSQNTAFSLEAPVRSVFGSDEVSASESFKKYAMSGLIQSTYLSGISPNEPPKYNIYFEEFGTIMREASYFDVRYDKAYPALSAKVSPTFNRMKGYTVSGFTAGAYGAEFLIFNATDTALMLDSTSGNYLRIQGVTFTQQSDNELSVDEYFERVGDLSNPQFVDNLLVLPPEKFKESYKEIKLSRITEGRKAFSIEAPYIQSQDTADSLMSWLSQKIMKPRKSVGVEIFGMPTIQLGDIVQIDYVNNDGVQEIASLDTRFVVYYTEYSRGPAGPSMVIYLSEVG